MQDDLVRLDCCPVCESSDFGPMIAHLRPNLPGIPGTYGFSRCRVCALGFSNPRPTSVALAALYELLPGGQQFIPGERGPAMSRFAWSNIADPSYRKVLAALPPGDILDVGCGQGGLLQLIVESGRSGSGVDFSAASERAGRARGLDIQRANLNDFVPQSGRYDGIVLRHVLEHIEDPVGLLERLRGGLRPSGRIVLEVPNLDSVTRKMFGSAWNGWDVPFHVNQFCARAMARALTRAGYSKVDTTTFGVVDEVRRSYERRVGKDGRYDLLRVAALPFYKTLGLFGAGSSLLATAVAA